jgi:hypothetical protein
MNYMKYANKSFIFSLGHISFTLVFSGQIWHRPTMLFLVVVPYGWSQWWHGWVLLATPRIRPARATVLIHLR